MFNYFQAFNSATLKAQFDAQLLFTTDLSNKMLEGVQKINELNVQVMKALFKESLANSQRLLGVTTPDEARSIIEEQAPPATEKIRAYQQHLQNILAETQAGVTEALESRVPETVRATEAVIAEVMQKVSEETMKATQRQQEVLEKFTTPLTQDPEVTAQAKSGSSVH